MSRSSPALNTHDRELTRLLAFCGGFMLVAAATYFIPGMELVQPWIAGERVPLVHLVLHDTRVVESYPGMLETRPADEAGGATLAPDAFDTGLVEGASPTGPVASADVEEDPAHEGLPEDSPAEEDADPDGPDAAEDNPPQPAVAEAVADEPTEDAVAIAIVAPIPPVDAPPVASPPEAQSVAVETDTRGAAAVSNRSSATANMARPGEGRLPDRSPAVGTPLEVPPGALDAWFTAMARAEAGVPGAVARALHWGDSTIAADGITKTVRSRLQGRFGDAGPGFLAIHVDPRWSMRPSVLRNTKGSWKTRTITFGGAGNPYYGLAGTVSTTWTAASSTLGGRKIDGERQVLGRADLSFQVRPGGGTVVVSVPDQPPVSLSTAAEAIGDAHHRLDLPAGTRQLTISTTGDGPVTVYGMALETGSAGVTWEPLGVAGASQSSVLRQGANHIARQIAQRDPDLIIYQMGGNELGYPALKSKDGGVWRDRYVKVVQRLRAGAPNASCLLITPLDQGERVRGAIHSKATLDTMIRLQREVAAELGCGFWDARAAMGGKGAYARWLSHKLAWGDLYHLTNKGLSLIGHSLADALEVAYDDWRKDNPVVAADSAASTSG